MKMIKKDKCEVNNDDCKGKLETHHEDGNPFNNTEENLKCLCASHHKLADKRKLSIEQLKNTKFEYYTDKSGKRRYK